jgi:hypothetical protein
MTGLGSARKEAEVELGVSKWFLVC